jgi:hypothetical protein
MSYTLKNNFMRDFSPTPTRPRVTDRSLLEMIKMIHDPVKLAKLRAYVCELASDEQNREPTRRQVIS